MLIKYPSPNLGLIIKHRHIQLKKAFLGTQKAIGNSQINKDRPEINSNKGRFVTATAAWAE